MEPTEVRGRWPHNRPHHQSQCSPLRDPCQAGPIRLGHQKVVRCEQHVEWRTSQHLVMLDSIRCVCGINMGMWAKLWPRAALESATKPACTHERHSKRIQKRNLCAIDLLPLRCAPAVLHHLQPRRPPPQLRRPVWEHGGRRGDQEGRGGALPLHQVTDQRDHLQRLAQPHLVREDAVEAVLRQAHHPLQALRVGDEALARTGDGAGGVC